MAAHFRLLKFHSPMNATAMSLNIKILFVALFISMLGMAQQVETDVEATVETAQSKSRKLGSITFGPYIPITFGNNFVNNGMDIKTGAQLQMKVNFLQKFYAGPSMSFFTGKVTHPELIGNYERTTNLIIGAVVGYEKQINRFDLSVGIGVGFSGYFNVGLGDKFNDTGTALWFRPEISYRLANYISIYVAPELRRDFMTIDVPKELEDTFGSVNYFNIGFGLRINLGSGYNLQ